MSEKYLYSASTGGIYPASKKEIYENSINGLPDDIVEINDETFAGLISGQEAGQRIIADKDGYPILSAQPEPTEEEVIASNTQKKTSLMKLATDEIYPLQDAIDLGEATDDEKEKLISLKKYRVALNRVDVSVAGLEWPAYPAF
ncbi:tail fiber assembly protein [Erwinia sp. S38]|uniref:tail fiber assembly protein n=1 Tax=Erwinia sp. S38 TaxID=2769338 RepID=UPI00190C57D3|nr:tail fiber assembly protein [Erwinia sp. S38]MBK0004390.1 tail fiber assembly protein [Erwinia sp. S38]